MKASYNQYDVVTNQLEYLNDEGADSRPDNWDEMSDDEKQSYVYEDHDIFTWAWDDFEEDVWESFFKPLVDKYGETFGIEGRNLNWRGQSGGMIKQISGIKDVWSIIESYNSDDIEVELDDESIILVVSHHDGRSVLEFNPNSLWKEVDVVIDDPDLDDEDYRDAMGSLGSELSYMEDEYGIEVNQDDWDISIGKTDVPGDRIRVKYTPAIFDFEGAGVSELESAGLNVRLEDV